MSESGNTHVPKPTDSRWLTLPDGFGVADWPEEAPATSDAVAERQAQREAWQRGELSYHLWIDPVTKEEITGDFLPLGEELTPEKVEDRTTAIATEWGSEVQFVGAVQYRPPTSGQ